MTQSEYFDAFESLCREELATTHAKNRDYASSSDPFLNFHLIERLTGGRVTTEDGILVRISDKLSRIGNLLDGHKPDVVDEKLDDTLLDLAVYAKILRIYLRTARDAKGIQVVEAQP